MNTMTICTRCSSPTKIVKTWIEYQETRSGKSKLTFTQIACSNNECQTSFDEKRVEEERKREEAKMRNEAYVAKKKADAEILASGKTIEKKKLTLR